MASSRHFTLIVLGDRENLKKYDKKNRTGEKSIVFRFDEAEKYYEDAKKSYSNILSYLKKQEQTEDVKHNIELISGKMDELNEGDYMDYYAMLTSTYEIDEEGNAVSDGNPNGKYDCVMGGEDMCMPMRDKDGNEVYSGKKSEIDWEKTNGWNRYTYEVVWDMVMEGKEPENDEERNLYENMKERTGYFKSYGDRETYVAANTAFWGLAVVTPDGEWHEIPDTEHQNTWITKFYERFIENLPDDTKITVMEGVRYANIH